ncbi:MAG TPA: hypothetical protein VII47_08240 [Actinomycetota bacterium]|jgi:hypothetical protein
MARKSTPRSGAQARGGTVIDRTDVALGIPPTPSEARPGSSVSLEMVNVFGEPVAERVGDAQGAVLRLTAWVNNVSYVKDVWVDAYLTDPSGAVVHSETLILDYREGAGGGGDFFVLDAPILAEGAATTPIARLQYRLYYQIGETVFAEGILHEQALASSGPAAPQLTSRPASKVVADAAPAKPRSSAKAVRKETGASPESRPAPGSGGAGTPAKRSARRRPSA